MKTFWKWTFRFGLVFVVVVALAVLMFDRVVRNLAVSKIRAQTGMETSIGKLRLHFLPPGIQLENLKLINTPEFGGTTFLDLPELRVELDREALSSRELRIKNLRLNLAELNIVVNKAGKTNTTALQERADQLKKEGGDQKPEKKRKQSPPEFKGLDKANVCLGTLRYTDLRDPDATRSYNFGVTNMVLENIKSKEELVPQLFIALLRSGVNLLDIFSGGIENLPRPEK